MAASKPSTGTDWAKADAYENTPQDYAEPPEIDDAFFERATPEFDSKPIRGRPPNGIAAKQQMTLRLDPAISARFRTSGPGWQARMNDFLAENETILKMIVDFDEAIVDMDKLVAHFRNGELRAVFEPAEATIARIEMNVRATRETVRTLREHLVWAPPTARPNSASDRN